MSASGHIPPRAIAVIGADGFIGSTVARMALEQGTAVTAVCMKRPWRLAEVIDDPRLRVIEVPGGRWWEERFSSSLAPELDRCAATVLLAYTPPSGSLPPLAEQRATNVAGAEAFARIAARTGRRLIFSSSADVYGDWHEAPVDERTATDPQTPYAEAKREAERRLLELAPRETAILRLSTVFGPGENGPRAIPSFLGALLDDGTPVIHGPGTDTKDYIHVEDVAAAILAACRRGSLPSPINVGSGVGRTTLSILAAAAEAVGVRARPRHVPSPRRPTRLVLDPSLARRCLGLAAGEDLVAALAEQAEWLASHRRATVEVGA